MSAHRVLALLLCLAPLLLSAAPGAGLPLYNNHNTDPSSTDTATNSSAPNCTDFSNATSTTYSSCWDTLNMSHYMFSWNYTAQACEKGEIWSTCFLRLAYGSPGYDCSRLGSLNCTAPRVNGPITDPDIYYGAFNIYAINNLFSAWQIALYAYSSQSAISQLALALSVPGAPRLTTSSLFAAIISHYGLDPAVDTALIDILPSGPKKTTSLDTNVTFYSTQLSIFLGAQLKDIMSDATKADFVWLAREGQMMAYTRESATSLEAKLAGKSVQTEASVTDGDR